MSGPLTINSKPMPNWSSDNTYSRALLDEAIFHRVIARTGIPALIRAGLGWAVKRTPALMTGLGKLRRCTEATSAGVDLFRFLAVTLVLTGLPILPFESANSGPSD